MAAGNDNVFLLSVREEQRGGAARILYILSFKIIQRLEVDLLVDLEQTGPVQLYTVQQQYSIRIHSIVYIVSFCIVRVSHTVFIVC